MSVAGFALTFAAGLVAGWLLRTFLTWRQQQFQQCPGSALPVPFPPPEGLVQAVKDEQLVLLAGTGLVANLCPKPVWLPAHTRELADVQNASRSWEGLYQALFGTIKRQYGPDFSAEIDKLLMDPAGFDYAAAQALLLKGMQVIKGFPGHPTADEQVFLGELTLVLLQQLQPDLDSMTAHAIRALGKVVKLALTTNYDGVLSTVLGRTMTSPAAVLQRWGSAVDYVRAGEASGTVARHRKELIQLHGSVYDKGSIVLMDPEYTATQTDFQKFMLPLVGQYSLLIIGSRGGAHDAHFTPMWQHVATNWRRDDSSDGSSHPMHTILALERESSAIRREFYSDAVFGDWAKEHIRVVEYGTQHAQLGPFLHQLAAQAGLEPSNSSRLTW